MPIGAGAAPAGTSAAGYGVPDAAFAPVNAILPAVRTGLPQTGRAIDPASKSYVMQVDGRLQGMATVPQLVGLAVTTIRGSSCLPTLGQTFSQIQEKGTNFVQQVTAAIQTALAGLIANKQVSLGVVSIVQSPTTPDTAIVQFTWTDLTTGLQSTTNIGP